jgi:hypothetical protein
LPIGLWRDAEQAQEAAAHRLLGAEAAAPRDPLHRQAELKPVARVRDRASVTRKAREAIINTIVATGAFAA